MKRVLLVFSLVLALLASAVGAQAAPGSNELAKVRSQIIPAVLRSADYRSAVATLQGGRVSVDAANVAIQSAGTSPEGKPVYTVALGTKGVEKGSAQAVLAFVEFSESEAKVLAVGLVAISAVDADGNRTFEISNPGKSQSVRSLYNPKTGEVLSMTKQGSSGEQLNASGERISGGEVGTQSICGWICWLAATVACTAVCVPIGLVTGGVGGFICSTVCSAVFNWVCGYCP